MMYYVEINSFGEASIGDYLPSVVEIEAIQKLLDHIKSAGDDKIQEANQNREEKYREWNEIRRAQQEPKLFSGYIYLVSLGEHTKIGRSKDWKARISSLFGDLGPTAQLIDVFYSSNHIQQEKELHKKFSYKQVRGEWFKLDESDIEEIRNMSTLIQVKR